MYGTYFALAVLFRHVNIEYTYYYYLQTSFNDIDNSLKSIIDIIDSN